LTLGRPEEAVRQLEMVRELLDAGGIAEPGFIPYGADLVEANLRAGRSREAERALERFAGQVEQTKRRWGQSTVARCRGMLGDLDAFETALQLHDADERPLERARTHLAYGERLRRGGRRVAAREELRRALELFMRHGAAPWAERARAELAASGETLRREHEAREQLTPQELQVAFAVSSGATNREAAAQLFLSPKTIEFHLRNTYRKLGVSSRTQLANALRQDKIDL
jgi:DNA-binding CsgD family transcriptional regulator